MANNFVLNKLIEGLNPQQRIAVTHSYNANTLVIAGAGSGKTNVLTKRIAFIIEVGYSTDNILAVTFTNKAADEMRKRVAKYIGEENSKKLLMGTFHSICVKLLRQFGKDINIPKYFTIYDSNDSKQIIKEVILEITGTSDPELIKTCAEKISNLKNNLISTQECAQSAITQDDRLLSMVYERYQHKLATNKSLDFDDLIFKTVNLLSYSDKALKYCNNRFKYVMCDEYQDTNSAQNKLLNLLVGKNNLFVVGDDSQGIYGWRGANINNILEFKKRYPSCNIIKLEQNYRSTQVIVNAGNELIKHNTKRLDKVCFSKNRVGEQIKIFNAVNDKQECQFIANEINNLVTYCNKQYKDFAVLYRVNSLTRELEDKFMNMGIPYEVVKGVSFYDRKEIKDTISIMRSTLNTEDNMAVKRYLSITPKIGKKTIEELEDISNKNNISLFEAIKQYDGRSKTHLTKAMKVISDLAKMVFNPVTSFIDLMFKSTGYISRLKAVNTEENESRIENLKELMNVATEFEKSNPTGTLEDFLDRVSLSTSQDKTNNDNRVKLLTVHASKGLEYNTVFIMACEENIFPHKKSMNADMDIEEERRLMYTAITRAEENLYITNSKSRMVYGNISKSIPSRFINEIPTYLKTEVF